MAKILILTLVFPPDSVSTAQIMGELAKDLQESGHEVTVLTTSPHYNRDVEAELRQPLHRFWGQILQKSNYSGIEVYHVYMPRKGKSVFLRLLSWVGFHLFSTIAGLTVVSRSQIIIAPSPPLTIGLGAWILGKFYHAPYIYNVQEIYPDIAVSLGALRNRGLIGFLLHLERFVYKHAGSITVIAPRMRDRLLGKGVPADKVKVIPNFVDTDDLSPLPKDNDFSRRYKIYNKFVVSYAGNVGPAQGLDTFIDVAALLKNEPDIHFMMIGNGLLWDTLTQRVDELGLMNFTCLSYQPYSLMPMIYAASDICLVPQAPETGCDAIPSKVYRIMACERPVLAFTDSNSDLAGLISSVGCGMVVQGGSSQVMADVIINAYKNPAVCRRMGKLGRRHVEEHYARNVVTNSYNGLIEKLAMG
jgi:putative colanic acid biosynthesis glycosyltransferase WcaI